MMKLLVDMFACQTGSRFRGIGRYTSSLISTMAKLHGENDMVVLADALYPESFETLRQEFIRSVPPGNFLPYYHEPVKFDLVNSVRDSQIAETLVKHAYQVISPDVVLTPSPFEGWQEKGVVPAPNNHFYGYNQVAIVYDFIPYLFQDKYLDTWPEYKTWYTQKLNKLTGYNLLLAISEATRQDAIKILGIEPDRVVNISGAASSQFRKLTLADSEKQKLLHRFGISRPFVLNVGAGDFRKNRDGALRAYSRLPRHIIDTHQLILAYNDGERSVSYSQLASLGFLHGDVIILEHAKDEDLVALYNLCKLFFFPSLYEGFGLPVLEAMSCGAPVIASNNSSLPEVVNCSDALFDAANDQQVTETLYRTLTDESFLEELTVHGLKNSKQFTWENTAQKAWDAIESLQKEKEQASKRKMMPVSAGKPRMRIAYVSPMPPQRSGISDYSADLLPLLADHFDIDVFVQPEALASASFIRDNLRFYPWMELLDHRNDYETVVYQVGNSPFHNHMIDLLQHMPGVVVQHDFFLNNIPFAREYLEGESGKFLSEINSNHGLRGMIEYIQYGVDNVRLKWPMNWKAIKYAQELIVHSKHQHDLARQFYGYGWLPSPTIINPLRTVSLAVSLSTKENTRNELGLDSDAFIFCSFGFLAPTKLNLIMLQAFSALKSAINKNILLVFVGELSPGIYEKQVLELIENLGIKKQVKITGFVSKEDYEKYLVSSDAAIQLRTDSRGETSAAVLDCLSNGIPLIVNSHGTLNDYSPEDVVKLPDPPNVEDIAQAMVKLITDDLFRMKTGQNGQQYIVNHHDPRMIASAYAGVICKAAQMDERKFFAPIFDLIELDESKITPIAKFAAANANLRSQPRILIDVTDIARRDWGGGIQRVTKNLIRELLTMADQSLHVELVRLQQGQVFYAYRFSESLFNLPENSLGRENPLLIQPGDTLFMMDATWVDYDQFLPTFDGVRKKGGKIVTMVYDLIPVRLPKTCAQVVLDAFELWLNNAIRESDQLICISKAVADDLIAYISDKQIKMLNILDVSYFHLGADIIIPYLNPVIQDSIQHIVGDKSSPLFLMVGTLEPRKGHSFALDAFEQLWQSGYNYRLCFAGKIGWNIAELEARIRNHPELNKRLFLIEKPTDAEINVLYSSATALIASSIAEGFGLPIVEAALHKVPVLASDIPVFREVGGDGALYFSLEFPTHLADTIISFLQLAENERSEMAGRVKVLTWKQSADWMLEILNGHQVYKTLEQPGKR
jgi:glycosyltransferase involved in cell wall biosynthesis